MIPMPSWNANPSVASVSRRPWTPWNAQPEPPCGLRPQPPAPQVASRSIGISKVPKPKAAVVVAEIPRNPSGKILKRELRQIEVH